MVAGGLTSVGGRRAPPEAGAVPEGIQLWMVGDPAGARMVAPEEGEEAEEGAAQAEGTVAALRVTAARLAAARGVPSRSARGQGGRAALAAAAVLLLMHVGLPARRPWAGAGGPAKLRFETAPARAVVAALPGPKVLAAEAVASARLPGWRFDSRWPVSERGPGGAGGQGEVSGNVAAAAAASAAGVRRRVAPWRRHRAVSRESLRWWISGEPQEKY